MPIYIGLGANLESSFGPPKLTLKKAVEMLPDIGAEPVRLSSWYRTAPVPASSQPDYVNGVVHVKTSLDPLSLLEALLNIEAHFGRKREQKWEPRVIDLDLLDFEGKVATLRRNETKLVLPHVRMHERAFVLAPLLELDPTWVHPRLRKAGKVLLSEAQDRRHVQRLA